jgi:DNA-binding response OmpR family regulator
VCVVTEIDCCPTGGEDGRRVLFVNADADLRAVVTRVLEREHYQVRAVAHSGHALLLCRTEAFDMAVVEISGPDVSGPSLMEQLRRHQPDLSSIYVGNPGSPDGIEQLLVRPFTRDELMEHIELALSGVAA